MTELLRGKVAVVTGGSSGNGREIARTFAEHGADVVVADVRRRPREGGVPTAELIRDETGARSAFVSCDVTRRADFEAVFDRAAEFGGVDVMVNNAGIFRYEEFLEVTEAEFDQMMDVNVKGVFFGAQEAIRRMLEGGTGGSLVNLSSAIGIQGSRNFVSYSASKGAVRTMSYALAAEFGPEGVRVNALHPGIVETSMIREDVQLVGTDLGEALREKIPLKRFAKPTDVAGAALFLASELSSYVNGASLLVDGGKTNTE